jgi:hypothetical protein
MSKVVEFVVGGLEIVAGILLTVFSAGTLAAFGVSLIIAGASMIMMGIAQLMTPQSRQGVPIRVANAPRKIVYGQMRVDGASAFIATNGNNQKFHEVVMWASHPIQSIDALYCDGRKLTPMNGYNGGHGTVDSSTHYDDDNNQYNFKGNLYYENSLGSTGGYTWGTLASEGVGWTTSCNLNGIAATYFRLNYDSTIFPSIPPAYDATIHGKCDIYDPRLGSYAGYGSGTNTGWTRNMALCILDVLLNPEFGLGCNISEIDLTNFSAQANICDQQVPLAAGGYENRYTCNGAFDTTSNPGEIIEAMLASCGGRLVYTQGVWRLFVGAWYGTGAYFTADQIIGNVHWEMRKFRELANGVKGQYTAATYPYAAVTSGGGLVDNNTKLSGVFAGMYQPCDIPPYAQDALHGYGSDANLAQDGGNREWMDIQLRFCTSCATAQRVAKIQLMRNRRRGSGTLPMTLWAYQNVPQDVVQMTFAPLGWSSKYLEISSVKFVTPQLKFDGSEKEEDGKDLSKAIYCEIGVNETDPTDFTWSTAEELTPTDGGSPTMSNLWIVNPPTSMTVVSGPSTAYVGADGITVPRLEIDWVQPADIIVASGGSIEIQYRVHTSSSWINWNSMPPSANQVHITPVVNGTSYDVQMRAKRANGQASDWVVTASPVTASATATSISGGITGVGALASLNYVDLATSQVINKTASNLNYSTGLSVEALRPAESLADKTSGKSLDILTDGSTYSRTLGNQSSNGVILGKTTGTNMLQNQSFEIQSTTALNLGDGWQPAGGTAQWLITRESASGVQHSGNYNVLIRMQPSVYWSAAQQQVISSFYIPCQGGVQYQASGWYSWLYNVTPPSGISVFANLSFFDSTKTYISGVNSPACAAGTTMNYYVFNAIAPTNAAYVIYNCCAVWYPSGGTGTSPAGNACDARFDDLALIPNVGSGILGAQGSIIPASGISVSYTTTSTGVTFTWSSQSMTLSDTTTLTVPSGSTSYSGLSPSTTYYWYPYVRMSDGTIQSPAAPVSSPSAAYTIQSYQDGRSPLYPVQFTTPASGSGTGGGTGGGGSTCPESAELVMTKDGAKKAGDVRVGDELLGYSFSSKAEVYRKITHIHTVTSAAWRIVNCHKVSPSEAVYVNDEWMPANRASKEQDHSVGTKVLLTVEADADQEHNYYLCDATGKPDLLIHNTRPVPC